MSFGLNLIRVDWSALWIDSKTSGFASVRNRSRRTSFEWAPNNPVEGITYFSMSDLHLLSPIFGIKDLICGVRASMFFWIFSRRSSEARSPMSSSRDAWKISSIRSGSENHFRLSGWARMEAFTHSAPSGGLTFAAHRTIPEIKFRNRVRSSSGFAWLTDVQFRTLRRVAIVKTNRSLTKAFRNFSREVNVDFLTIFRGRFRTRRESRVPYLVSAFIEHRRGWCSAWRSWLFSLAFVIALPLAIQPPRMFEKSRHHR